MADSDILIPLDFLPGVQRDGTALDSDRALDAQWCRWRLSRPRKMGGYSQIVANLKGVPRRIHMYYKGSQVIIHIGTSVSLEQVVVDQNGLFVSQADRTPVTFAAGPNVGWTLDAVFDTVTNVVQLVAHAVPDLSAAANNTQTTPFLGQIDAVTMLGPFSSPGGLLGGNYAQPNVAGGIVAVQPYVFDFDANGFVGWSAPNQPNFLGVTGGTSGAGAARISAQKIIAGASLRGGGANSPAALFWSLSELLSATFVGSPAFFAFNTVSPSSSILSSDCVIEYDGLYFWAGIDRFLVYNGTVVEVPNQQNLDWFFNNMNWTFAAKTFAFKVPRYGEIWWCAPLFGNTEPSHAVIYNLRENCWYDTVLPNSGRSAGYFAQGFRFPVMGGSTTGANGYSLWLHENGLDQIVGTTPTAIRSYFETPYMSGTKLKQLTNQGISAEQFEPDLSVVGDMLVNVVGTWNPREPDFSDAVVTLKGNPNTPQEEFVGLRSDRRLLRLHIESNTLGGNYTGGKSILHAKPGAARLFK